MWNNFYHPYIRITVIWTFKSRSKHKFGDYHLTNFIDLHIIGCECHMLPRTKFPIVRKAVFVHQVSSLKGSRLFLNTSSNEACPLHNTLSSLGRSILCETWKVAIKICGWEKAKVFFSYLVHTQRKSILGNQINENQKRRQVGKEKKGSTRKMSKKKNSNVCVTDF